MQESWFDSWFGKIRWRRDRLPTPVFSGFPCGSAGKESACNVGDLGSIPGLGRSPGKGNGYPLQYSGLENSMDSTVHGVARDGHNWAIFTFIVYNSNLKIVFNTDINIQLKLLGSLKLWFTMSYIKTVSFHSQFWHIKNCGFTKEAKVPLTS